MHGTFTLTYEPMTGSRVEACIAECVSMACGTRLPVEMNGFNGVDMTIAPGSSVDTCVSQWHRLFLAKSDAYRNSQEGKVDAEYAKSAQLNTMLLVEMFDDASKSLDTLVAWAGEFSKHANHVAVKFDKDGLARRLENLGYRENAYVKDVYKPMFTKRMMGEYIIGQVIICLKMGMPPHQITAKFADYYAKMPK